MDTNKMRSQFEEAFIREQVRACGEGFRCSAAYMVQQNMVTVRMAWWAWQASRATSWQPMESCPKHVEVLFYREDCGVISGQLTYADTFMTDKDRESGDYSEEEQYSEDAWCYGLDGVERLDGDLVPTHWMPYPDEPEVTP